MKVFISVLLFFSLYQITWSQENQLIMKGKVLDGKTKEPLSFATIKVKAQDIEFFSSSDGGFEFAIAKTDDSLEVSHIGYKTFKEKVNKIKNPAAIYLETDSVKLKSVTITSRKLNLKEIDNSLRIIKGNLYAYETETTNSMYNLFLSSLEEQGRTELLKACDYDLSAYDETTKAFYRTYTAPYKAPINKKDTLVKNYTNFPAVNISHSAAVLFCQWLTDQYNNNTGKKKFKKLMFRLPTLKEWQIAALGYYKFQTWNLEENKIEVLIPSDSMAELGKGVKTIITVDHDILYPWWGKYHYRNKPTNHRNCYLGNFKVPANSIHCLPARPGLDGWTQMAITASYFPNNIGLYDVVGNVAEMIDEKGKACGGSWGDPPSESTIHSVKSYRKADATIGFRVFIEVLDE